VLQEPQITKVYERRPGQRATLLIGRSPVIFGGKWQGIFGTIWPVPIINGTTLTPLPCGQLCEGEDYGLSDSGLALLALLEQGDGGCGGQEDLGGVAVSASNVAG
jgi:hypothetical protein